MEKEFIKETQHSVTLNVTAGKIDSFREIEKTTGTVRVYENGCIGVAGALGEPDEEKLTEQAKEALSFGIPYPCQRPPRRAVSEVRVLTQDHACAQPQGIPQFQGSSSCQRGQELRDRADRAEPRLRQPVRHILRLVRQTLRCGRGPCVFQRAVRRVLHARGSRTGPLSRRRRRGGAVRRILTALRRRSVRGGRVAVKRQAQRKGVFRSADHARQHEPEDGGRRLLL